MRTQLNDVARRLLMLALSLCVLWLILEQIPLSATIAALGLADTGYLLQACVIVLFSQAIIAVRLRMLTVRQGVQLGTVTLLGINLASIFYGLFVPGGTLANFAVRSYKLSRNSMHLADALSTITVDRILATAMLCVSGVLFWLVDRPLVEDNIGVVLTVALVAVIGLYLLLFHRMSGALWRRLTDLAPDGRIRGGIQRLSAAMSAYHDLPAAEMLLILAYAFLPHMLGILVFMLLGSALGMTIDVATWGWMRSIVILVTMLPVSFAGIGLRDGALIFLLSLYGVPGSSALALSFLILAATVILPAALGGLLEGKLLLRALRKQSDIARN